MGSSREKRPVEADYEAFNDATPKRFCPEQPANGTTGKAALQAQGSARVSAKHAQDSRTLTPAPSQQGVQHRARASDAAVDQQLLCIGAAPHSILPECEQEPYARAQMPAPECVHGPASRVWSPLLVERIASHLPRNVVACTLRLVDKATAALLSGPQHTTVHLSEPSPPAVFAACWGAPNAMRPLSLKQRQHLLALTAGTGVVLNLQLALTAADCKAGTNVLEAAASAGHLEACRCLLQTRGHTEPQHAVSSIRSMVSAAARAGHCEVVWALLPENDRAILAQACESAARGGRLGLLRQLLQRYPGMARCSLLSLVAAGMEGLELPIVEALHAEWGVARVVGEMQRSGSSVTWAMEKILASAAGSPTADWRDKVLWCERNGCERSGAACVAAAALPDAACRLAWLSRRGYPMDAGTIQQVADKICRTGNIAAWQYMLAAGHRPPMAGCLSAAFAGHLDFLVVLQECGVPICDSALPAAARGGHLHVLAWLANVCQVAPSMVFRDGLLSAGAESGRVEVVAWLTQHFPLQPTSVAFNAAVRSGSQEVLAWLVERGCPMGEDGFPYVIAGQQGDLATLRALRSLGCPWGPGAETFANCVHHEFAGPGCQHYVLQWLLDEGCPVDWDLAISRAWKDDTKEWLKWHRHRYARV